MVEDASPTRLLLTGIILVLMVPFLVIEPAPVSEAVGIMAIGAVWGIDLTEGK